MTASHDPNDPNLRSFVPVPVDSHFPIQNLPFGIFCDAQNTVHRVGVTIGDQVLDLALLEQHGLISTGSGPSVFQQDSLNAFMQLGPDGWRATRERISWLLSDSTPALRDDRDLRSRAFVPQKDVALLRPVQVAAFTDFYSSKQHALNGAKLLRNADELFPNWYHLPVAYNARANTVVVSGTPIVRPRGQIKLPDLANPVFLPSQKLDYELEMGFFVGQDSRQGSSVTVEEADQMIFGFVLLNDWSARDIQQWEATPLGPFQAKIFATSISPWVILKEALEPFRVQGPAQDPAPLPYLRQSFPANYAIHLEVSIRPSGASPILLSRADFRDMYWSSAQQLTHHAIGGCAMSVGDLLGSGTISGSTPDSVGSLLEMSRNGARPVKLDNGEQRCYLEDGDEVIMTGWCQGAGYRIGFGEVRGVVLPSSPAKV